MITVISLEPDLPPLIVEQSWIDEIKATLPELPLARKIDLLSNISYLIMKHHY